MRNWLLWGILVFLCSCASRQFVVAKSAQVKKAPSANKSLAQLEEEEFALNDQEEASLFEEKSVALEGSQYTEEFENSDLDSEEVVLTEADLREISRIKKQMAQDAQKQGQIARRAPASRMPATLLGGPVSQSFVVKKGQNIFWIAEHVLGDRSAWKSIAQANGLKNPKVLKAGTVLNLEVHSY